MLARMGAVLDLDAKPARSNSMHEIRELHIALTGLIKDRAACRNRLQGAWNKVVLSQLRARLRQVEKQIDQIDTELQRFIAKAPGLAGLAPITRVPRKWKRRSKIGGGRAGLRTMLFMPALVATRDTRQLGKTYRTLCDAGKPTKVAITAVMR